jgi:hypothetical protein
MSTPLAELRRRNVKAKEVEETQETDHITSHITDHITGLQAGNMVSKSPDKAVVLTTGQSAGQPSIREVIRQNVREAGGMAQAEVMIPVTIKLRPSMNRRVNDHCHDAGRLKQDVIHDALLLYFEVVEEETGDA